MPSQTRSPASITSVPNDFSTIPWSSPGNVAASNDVYATAASTPFASDEVSETLWAVNYGFTLPASALVLGVVVEYERKELLSAVEDYTLTLIKGGVASGQDKAASGVEWPIVDAYAGYGSPVDKWGIGVTLNASAVNATDFGSALSVIIFGAQGATAFVDHNRITVYYDDGVHGSPPVELVRALELRARRHRWLRAVRRALWSPDLPIEEVQEFPGEAGLLNAARRLELRGRRGRPRVLSWAGGEEESPGVQEFPGEAGLLNAARRLELRGRRATRAFARAWSMGGGHGEGPFALGPPTLKSLGEFTKREIWAQTGLRPGERPPWRRRR